MAQPNDAYFTVGVVPQFDSREIENIWQPVLKEISQRTGITLELRASPSIPEFEKEFQQGAYHFAYMNPYHAVVANQMQGYQPILRDTSNQLKGIIVVRKDNPITNVKQLDGKLIAMPAPNALGAALLPRAEFATIYHINPKYKYVKSHDSVYLNVVLGQAEAGGGVEKTLNKQLPAVRDKLRILYTTQGMASHPIVAHPSVPQKIVKQVQKGFLELALSEDGKKLLEKIPIKQIGVSSMADYGPLKELGLENFYVKNE